MHMEVDSEERAHMSDSIPAHECKPAHSCRVPLPLLVLAHTTCSFLARFWNPTRAPGAYFRRSQGHTLLSPGANDS